MTDEKPPLKVGLEVLLRHDHRGLEAAHAAATRLADLGFKVSGIGETSLALELSRDAFSRMFGRAPTPPNTGEPFAPWVEPCALQVPSALEPWVESLFEARPASHFKG